MHSLKNVLLGLAMAVLAACGSEKKEPEPITAPERPNIEQGPANAVSYVEGSYDRPYKLAVSSDAWYLVDRSQGVIRVDQATQESEVIAKFKANDAESLIESAAAIELNGDESALFVLDTEAKQIVSIDLASAEQTQFVTSEAFAVSDNFAWYAPTDLVMDAGNGRLLVGDRNGLVGGSFAFVIFSVDTVSRDVSVIAENSLAEAPLQGFDARAFAYDSANGNFYVSGLVEVSGQCFYTAYRINEDDWTRKALSINISTDVSRTIAAHDVYYSEGSGVFLIDSVNRAVVNIIFEGDTTKTRVIKLSSDGNAYPVRRPVAFYFTGENTATVLDEGLSALLSVDFTVRIEQDDDGTETGYSAESNRTLLASGRKVYEDPTEAPQIVFDMHFHQASGKLMITDSAASQVGILSYAKDDGYSRLLLNPVINELEVSEETSTVNLADGQDIEDVRPKHTPSPKPIFVSSDLDGELFVYGRDFFVETKDPVINYDENENPESVTFTYNHYGPAIYTVDLETLEATPISINNSTDDLSSIANVPFENVQMNGMAISDDGVYFLPSSPYTRNGFTVYYWSFNEKTYLPKYIDLDPDVGVPYPSEMTYDAFLGEFILSDAVNDAILRLDPTAKTLSTLSGRSNNGDIVLLLPSGVATDQGVTAYTFENSLKALVEVDMSTGNRTRLDSTTNYIRSVSKLTYDADGKTIYLLEKLSQRIIAIDLDTLEQTWVE